MSFHVLEVMDESARHTRARASGDTRITNVMVRARRETRERGRRTGLFAQREVFTYKSEGCRLSQFIKVMRTSTVFYSLFIRSI